MNSITDFLRAFLPRALFFGALYSILFLFQILRADLMNQPAKWFLAACLAWAALWLVSVFNAARPVAYGASLFLVWITLQGLLPGATSAVRTTVQELDAEAGRAAGTPDREPAARTSPSPPPSEPTPSHREEEFQPIIVPETAPPPAGGTDGFLPLIPQVRPRPNDVRQGATDRR